MSEETSTITSSMAFKEYAQGRNKKVKPPWATIIISGLLVAVASILTEIFAAVVFENPWAFNFIISLYGIPAGFACALKNKTFTALVSLRYSTFSALITIGVFGIITFIYMLISSSNSLGIIVGFVQLLGVLGIMAIFFICVTFATGAMLGTIFAAVRDAKGH